MTTSISKVDYQKLLQKIAVLETEVHLLRANLGVNEQHKTKLDSCTADKKAAWNSIGAKPKAAFNIPTVITNRRLTGRTRSPDNTEWPPLPSRLSASSTPLQLWKTVKGSARTKAPAQKMVNLHLSNKFSPLLQIDSSSAPDDRLSSGRATVVTPNMVRNSVKMSPEDCLIVGDETVKHMKGSAKRKFKVLCFPKASVSDMNARISAVVAAHPTVKRLILHIGARDTEKQQSEILKKNFLALFQTLRALNLEVCISAPLPPMRGSERFSRLFGLNE